MSQNFIKNTENFVCDHCGKLVRGNGYTNHCPSCLWSKHVDVNPGDRAAVCGGPMSPVTFERRGDDFILIHRCQVCGHEKRNKVIAGDNLALLAEL